MPANLRNPVGIDTEERKGTEVAETGRSSLERRDVGIGHLNDGSAC